MAYIEETAYPDLKRITSFLKAWKQTDALNLHDLSKLYEGFYDYDRVCRSKVPKRKKIVKKKKPPSYKKQAETAKKKLEAVEKQNVSLTKNISSLSIELAKARAAKKCLEKKVKNLEKRIDELNNYGREDILDLEG